MDNKICKWLYDALEASKNVKEFVIGKTVDDYRTDVLLKSGVERQFEIVGEALNRIKHRN